MLTVIMGGYFNIFIILSNISMMYLPSKNALARSCKILWDFAGILKEPCCKFLQDSCKIPHDPTRSHKMQVEKTFSWKILQERFYWAILDYSIMGLYSHSCGICVKGFMAVNGEEFC